MSDLELTLWLCVVGTNDEEERKQEALANKFIQEETVGVVTLLKGVRSQNTDL